MFLLAAIAELQTGAAQAGAFEIGVHHGRYLIALHLLCEPGSQSVGIDLFDQQEKNVDRSGSGDLEIARSSIERYARDPNLIHLITADSLALTDGEIRRIEEDYGPFRLLSIDGGHTREHAVRDLLIGARVAHPEALILIDDYFHPGFPGVTEGYYRLAESSLIPFVPLYVTLKKLVLCHVSERPRYWEALVRTKRDELDGIARAKVVRIAGHDTIFYNV